MHKSVAYQPDMLPRCSQSVARASQGSTAQQVHQNRSCLWHCHISVEFNDASTQQGVNDVWIGRTAMIRAAQSSPSHMTGLRDMQRYSKPVSNCTAARPSLDQSYCCRSSHCLVTCIHRSCCPAHTTLCSHVLACATNSHCCSSDS
jgi:hypothetical protein